MFRSLISFLTAFCLGLGLLQGQTVFNCTVGNTQPCLNQFYADSLLVEGYNPSAVGPFGGYDRTNFNFVSGLPNGITAQFSNTVLDWTSPVSTVLCSSGFPSITIYFTGSPTEFGTFPVYVNFTEDSDPYFLGQGTGGQWSPGYSTTYTTLAFTLTIAAPTTVTSNATLATCGSANGMLSVMAAGGNGGPYSYSWNTGQIGNNASGLSAGFQTVYVTDNLACVYPVDIVLGSTGGPTVTPSVQMTSCSNNGSLQLNVTGTSPYTYSWSNGNTNSSQNITGGLSYEGLVWDGNNCPTAFQVSVPTASILTTNYTKTDIDCFPNTNGAISLTATGGTTPYSYSWSNGVTGAAALNLTNLSEGDYISTVADANGCVLIDTIHIHSPKQLKIAAVADVDQCLTAGIAGIDIAIKGGTLGADVKINGTFFHTYQDTLVYPKQLLYAGSYFIEAVDANGCQADTTVIIGDGVPTLLSVTNSCLSQSGGSIVLDPINYGYYWMDAVLLLTGQTYPSSANGDFNNLPVGEYFITLYASSTSQQYGCQNLNLDVLVDTNVVAVFSQTQVGNTFNFNTYSSGLNSPLTFAWTGTNLSGGASPSFSATNVANPSCSFSAQGNYEICLTATDNQGCSFSFCDTIAYIPTCDIGGQVTIGGNAADDYTVYLIQYDAASQLLTALDSVVSTSTSNGNFLFPNLPFGDYRVKAALNPASTQYANYLPTYYINSLLWNQANVISLNTVPCTSPFNIDLQAGVNPGGPGFIGGYVFNGANKTTDTVLKAQVAVILFNNTWQTVSYDISDANGYVSFANLAYGTYHLVADKMNYLSDTVTITIGNGMGSGHFSFYLLADSTISGVNNSLAIGNPSLSASQVQIAPNPYHNHFQILTQLPESGLLSYEIITPLGQSVWQSTLKGIEGENQLDVRTDTWAKGIYFLRVRLDDKEGIVLKLIKE